MAGNAPDIADEFDGKLPYVIVSNSNALVMVAMQSYH
jgi:hypothetical protein